MNPLKNRGSWVVEDRTDSYPRVWRERKKIPFHMFFFWDNGQCHFSQKFVPIADVNH